MRDVCQMPLIPFVCQLQLKGFNLVIVSPHSILGNFQLMYSFVLVCFGTCIAEHLDDYFFSLGVGETAKEKHANASGGAALPCDPDMENQRYSAQSVTHSRTCWKQSPLTLYGNENLLPIFSLCTDRSVPVYDE